MRRSFGILLTLSLGPLSIGLLASGCFTLDFDGDGTPDRLPPAGYEVDELACSNGLDDDQDGRVDCQDEDCLMHQHCGEQIPNTHEEFPEDTFSYCIDGIDNDLDGQFDCGDRGCQSIRELCCLSEFDDASCSDGVDNDGNGFADCADFSCRNGVFVTVCEAETDCTDRIDNDGDRRTDCNDSDCADEPMCAERNCDNGRDDDGDGLVDCEDPSCAGTPACPAETDCTNGIDDNGNGRTDCADQGCAADPACAGPENTAERCSDGISNDGDAFVDCADFDCADFCEAEETLEACMDGVDNDGNGFIDCNDFSCSRSSNPAVLEHCASTLENTFERCTDGVDNDGNGFTDCDDNGCGRSPDRSRFCVSVVGLDPTGPPQPCADDSECRSGLLCRDVRFLCEADQESCSDRRDNNRNGFSDCADFSCQFVRFDLVGRCDAADQCPGAGQACFRGSCIEVTSPCQEGAEPGGNFTLIGERLPDDITPDERRRFAVAGCTDGADNDLDGFVDCEDWDCNYNPLVVDDAGNPICRFAGGRTCVRGPRAGQRCAGDGDCGGIEGACGPAGRAGGVFVCP